MEVYKWFYVNLTINSNKLEYLENLGVFEKINFN